MSRPKLRPAGTLLLLLCGTLLLEGFPSFAQSPVKVSLAPERAGAEIAPDYLGLSFEMQQVLPDTNENHFFTARNKRLVATFKTLGIKSLRVGGNTADRPTLPTPGKSDVDSLFAFAKAAHVKVIFTLRLNHGDPGQDAKMADYILHYYRRQLTCFAIGNEPNVFSTNYEVYLAEWKRYAACILAPTNSPDAQFGGPGVSPGHETWSGDFAEDLGWSRRLKFITQHDYPGGDARKVKDPAAGRDKILSPAMDEHYLEFAGHFVPAILSNGLPYRLEEANSFYDGGAKDVSDTFASALWALDYLWWWAGHDACGVNFHTGDQVATAEAGKPCYYATFWTAPDGYNVRPIGYAEKMFALGSRGRLLPVVVTNQDNLDLTVYAAMSGKRAIYVTLINRDHGSGARAANVTLAPGFKKSCGQVMFLTAPDGDVAAKTGVTLGGAEIQDNAVWKGKWAALPKPDRSGQFSLNLPTATAALVKFTGR
jgi:hypothetical protein